MKNLLAACVLGLVGMGVAGGQGAGAPAKRPMTFQDLMAMKRVSDPQVSPTGKWVMFSVTEVSLEKNTKVNHLWVVPIGGGKERMLGNWPGALSNGRFSPDGKTVSATATDAGDGRTEIYLADWHENDGTLGEMHRLTALATDADGAIWSPDSRRLLFVSSVYPECSDRQAWAEEEACDAARDKAADSSPVKAQLWTSLLYRHWNAYTGLKRSHVLVVSASDGRDVRDLTPRSAVGEAETPTFSLGGPLGYAWAPDSKEIAYVTNLDQVPAASTNNDVFTLRLDEPGARAVRISTSPGSDDGPQYSPDGKWLAFRSQARAGYESDRFRLMVLDRAKKTVVEAAPDFPGWVEEFMWPGPNPYLLFTSAYQGEERVYGTGIGGTVTLMHKGGEFGSLATVPIHGGPIFSVIATKMKAILPSEIVRLNFSDSGSSGIDEHGKVVRDAFGIEVVNNTTEQPITKLNMATLHQLALTPLEPFWFPGAESTQVQGFLIRPPNFDSTKKYPVKFLIHGGPQGAWGDAWSYRWNPELMAASGYVVVMVNPRGSTGYGQAFIDGVNGDWGGKAYVDLMKGLDAAEAQFPFIDKTRECALGASYGGFMANWVLTHTDRFKCIVSHDGMYNPVSAYGTTEELWFNEWEFRRTLADGKLDPQPGQPWRYAKLPEDQDPFRKCSPMLHIQEAKTPTLVIHGQRDYRLDVSEGLQLFQALQRQNVPSEMLYFPDEGHWVLKPQNSELWNKTVSDWCDKWTHTNAYAGK